MAVSAQAVKKKKMDDDIFVGSLLTTSQRSSSGTFVCFCDPQFLSGCSPEVLKPGACSECEPSVGDPLKKKQRSATQGVKYGIICENEFADSTTRLRSYPTCILC